MAKENKADNKNTILITILVVLALLMLFSFGGMGSMFFIGPLFMIAIPVLIIVLIVLLIQSIQKKD